MKYLYQSSEENSYICIFMIAHITHAAFKWCRFNKVYVLFYSIQHESNKKQMTKDNTKTKEPPVSASQRSAPRPSTSGTSRPKSTQARVHEDTESDESDTDTDLCCVCIGSHESPKYRNTTEIPEYP